MFLSSLLIKVGDNPDRPRPGRLWLRNIYHVHQRLCMAFPSNAQRTVDPRFVMPFNPEGFFDLTRGTTMTADATSDGSTQPAIHVPRDSDHNFLFRIDSLQGNRVVILVKSALRPDWNYAFQNADFLLDAPPQCKEFTHQFAENCHYHFRLRANPAKKSGGSSKSERLAGIKKKASRLGLMDSNDQIAWLLEKARHGGFSIPGQWRESAAEKIPDFRFEVVREGFVSCGKKNHDGRFVAVRFDGVLTVTDPALFRQTLEKGIGPAKAFGFGLLSIAAFAPSAPLAPLENPQ